MTVMEAATVREALRVLQKEDMTFKQSYWVTKILSRLEVPLKPFDEVRDAAIKKYGTAKDGGFVIDSTEKMEKYQDELKEIVKDTIDVDVRLLKLEDFNDISITGLVADTLLRYVFEEGAEFDGEPGDGARDSAAEGRPE